MNHAFLLRQHAGLSLEEQNGMTFEDRKWWLNRTKEELEKKQAPPRGSTDRDHTPGQPPI
jgi:hypothetical protein